MNTEYNAYHTMGVSLTAACQVVNSHILITVMLFGYFLSCLLSCLSNEGGLGSYKCIGRCCAAGIILIQKYVASKPQHSFLLTGY